MKRFLFGFLILVLGGCGQEFKRSQPSSFDVLSAARAPKDHSHSSRVRKLPPASRPICPLIARACDAPPSQSCHYVPSTMADGCPDPCGKLVCEPPSPGNQNLSCFTGEKAACLPGPSGCTDPHYACMPTGWEGAECTTCSSTTPSCPPEEHPAPPPGCDYGPPVIDANGCQVSGPLLCNKPAPVCPSGWTHVPQNDSLCSDEGSPAIMCTGHVGGPMGPDEELCYLIRTGILCPSSASCISNLNQTPVLDGNGCVVSCKTISDPPPPVCKAIDCAAPPPECSYGPPVLDSSGCPIGCGKLICNPPPVCQPVECPQPAVGCNYGPAKLDSNHCPVDCGPLECSGIGGGVGSGILVSVNSCVSGGPASNLVHEQCSPSAGVSVSVYDGQASKAGSGVTGSDGKIYIQVNPGTYSVNLDSCPLLRGAGFCDGPVSATVAPGNAPGNAPSVDLTIHSEVP